MNQKLKGLIIMRFGTQYDFSRVVNEHEAYVSKIVRNRRILPDFKKEIWADILGSTPEELFPENKKP